MTVPTDRAEVVELYRRHLGQGAARVAEQAGLPVEVRSEGPHVWDADGRRYLDCGGYGVFLLGHRHPKVVAAVHEQLDRHPLATRSLLSPELAAAARDLAAVAPDGLDYVYFGTSGAEAVETAIKLGRATGRRRVVTMDGGFHGKTLGALSVSHRPAYRLPFQPLLPGVQSIPFGDVDALAEALAGEGKAVVIMEPVQGEAGVRLPPPGYLAAVEACCEAADAFLVLDEVQTGLGRLGHWWGADLEGIRPDLLLAGKGLGGGVVPVSAVVATERAYAPLSRNPRLHSSTFAGAPLVMAAVTATLQVMREEDVVARAAALGERLLPLVRDALAPAMPEPVLAVRGCGLLIGVEVGHPALAGRMSTGLLRRGVVATTALGVDTVLRLSLPVALDDDDVRWLVDALGEVAAELAADPTAPGAG